MASITFDDAAKFFVLDGFGKTINDNSTVVEKSDPSKAVRSTDGQEIKIEKFAGIRKGSEIYIKSDIVSLVELADILKEKQV